MSDEIVSDSLREFIQESMTMIKTLCEGLPDSSNQITAQNKRHIIESINVIYGAALDIEDVLKE